MANLDIWNRVKNTPDEARKRIAGGRLKNMTDINPVWRLMTLTEVFGPCGEGWKYEVRKYWLEKGAENEVRAFATVDLYWRRSTDDEWSAPVPGIGGASFVTKEQSGGVYVNDECYKMALTDAISVACKALGMSQDIYFAECRDKYTAPPEPEQRKPAQTVYVCEKCGLQISDKLKRDGTILLASELAERSKRSFGRVLCIGCAKMEMEAQREAENQQIPVAE